MPKRKIEADVLNYFNTAPLDKVELMLTLVKSAAKKRTPKPTLVAKQEPKGAA